MEHQWRVPKCLCPNYFWFDLHRHKFSFKALKQTTYRVPCWKIFSRVIILVWHYYKSTEKICLLKLVQWSEAIHNSWTIITFNFIDDLCINLLNETIALTFVRLIDNFIAIRKSPIQSHFIIEQSKYRWKQSSEKTRSKK